ncbi:thiamine phosphate synthase [Vibrio aquaticus]|uniref:Thiamine phosphate synthase n=1 Tax=Vibrio aquaticus TaxID=2496559 RepID=A0A432CVN1_9VIBR|nr:thiamine phosphate synthase [Vibrio aquaticus]RTZ14169.1 thiamine phosphate synthase [Vibrio aquaticus]
MAKILIPPAQNDITGLVQQCLLLAEEQGFCIEDIELGVSPTHSIQLVHEQQCIHFKSDLIEMDDSHIEESFLIHYRSSLSVENCANQGTNSIFVGIKDHDRVDDNSSYLDIWRHQITNDMRALSFYSDFKDEFIPEYHLSWLVTLSVLDFPIEDSLTLARAMATRQAHVSRETRLGEGGASSSSNLWAHQFSDFPTPVLEDERLGIHVGWASTGSNIHFSKLNKQSLGLYPVVDDVEWIKKLLHLGIKTVQLRIKNPQQGDLEQQVIRAIELGREYDAKVFINDYWQLAIKHNAFGVHLGQEDIEESNLSQLSDAGIRLGLSTHGYYELLRITQIHPSYIALGHIFPTTTKKMPSKPQGLVRLALYQKLIDSIPYRPISPVEPSSKDTVELGYPTVAIGGIDLDNVRSVWQTGVSSLAVVRAITLADSPKAVIDMFSQLMSREEGNQSGDEVNLSGNERSECAL